MFGAPDNLEFPGELAELLSALTPTELAGELLSELASELAELP